MLDDIDELYKTVKTYKSSTNYVSIFNEISNYHYRENYHSDILALYLRFKEVKYEFIHWINSCLSIENKSIDYDEYADGSVEREENRIAILLYSSDKKKAIIIENKSNNAGDQPKQLYRYLSRLKRDNVFVEAIFYLNKSTLKHPDLTGLSEAEIDEINEILIIGKLVKDNSLTENVIKKVIAKTNNIRLNALSQEIIDLFNTVIYGEINMEDLGNFVKELSENDNLEKLQKIIEAYNDIPKYLLNEYTNYLNSKNTGYRIWVYNKSVLVIDNKTKDCINFAVDVSFSVKNISFELWVRNKGKWEISKEEILEKIKNDVGEDFPFKEPLIGRGYKINIKNTLDDVEIKRVFDCILEIGKKYMV